MKAQHIRIRPDRLNAPLATCNVGKLSSAVFIIEGDMSLNSWQWPGGAVEPACRGSRSSTSYAQIDGSNLYALTTTSETIQVRGKQGTYDSGWQS